MGTLLAVICIISCILFIILLAFTVIFAGEIENKYMAMLISGVIVSCGLFIFCLCATEKKETIGIYNEYEYDIKAMLCDLPKDKIIYKTDGSRMAYIKIEKYVFPISHQYYVTIYNYNLGEKDMAEYKYERP